MSLVKQKLDHRVELLSQESEELQLTSEHRGLNSASSERLALLTEPTEVEGVKEPQYKLEQLECFSIPYCTGQTSLEGENEWEKEAVSCYNTLEKA